MNAEQADRLLFTLKAAFPHADTNIDPLKVTARDALYRQAFLAWGSSSAQEAVLACVKSCRFYPTVAELHDAYTEAARSKPERSVPSNALPAPGHTTASPEEVRAACQLAVAKVEANAVIPEVKRTRGEGTPERAIREMAGATDRVGLPPELGRKAEASGE